MNKGFTIIFLLLISTNSDAQTGWAWMKGNNGAGGNPVFGTQGIPDPANRPQPLYEPAEFIDLQGNFWLFGGMLDNTYPINTLWKFDPIINQWTWIDGSQSCCEIGSYGTQGIPNLSNYPGARKWAAASWTDFQGNFWLFGGTGYDALGTNGELNDLWKYDLITGEWTWMKGSEMVNASGLYGTQGVSSPLNTPGARHECGARWVDNDGNLWLFGGVDVTYSFVNDLWKYDIATNEWTWMKGSNLPFPVAIYGTLGVPSPSNTPGGRTSYNKWKDSNGNFWLFGGYDFNDMNDLWKYDPISNEWTWMDGPNNYGNPNGNYSTHCDADTANLPAARLENRAGWVDEEDRLWMFGGYTIASSSQTFNDLWYYEVDSGKWNWLNGSNGGSPAGVYGVQGIPNPANHPSGRGGSVGWFDNDCHFWMFGGVDFTTLSYYNDLWKFVADSGCGSCALSLQSNFFASDTTLCEKFCVDFFDVTSNAIAWAWSFPGGSPPSSTDKNPSDICYQTPGIYDVTLITSNGSGANDTLTLADYITVYTNPLSPVISQLGNVLTSTPAFSYQWLLNAIIIPGATNQSITIAQSGLYTVQISDSNGCSAQASIDASVVTGISSNGEESFAVYPNPAPGVFTIDWQNMPASSAMKIEVTNGLGSLIYSATLNGYSTSIRQVIDIGEISEGIYFIQVITDAATIKRKILISQ